ncbi:MAG: acyltransferase [Actinobacteria bacterium]|nr:acyltransferase [Actinomycetota bacterium]
MSKLSDFQDVYIGKKGPGSLLKYELLTQICCQAPGACGLFLRSVFYRYLLGKIGKKTYVGRNVTLRHPHKITIGRGTIIDDNAVLDAKGDARSSLTIGDNCFISSFSILTMKNGKISLGDNVRVGTFCRLAISTNLTIEDDVMIASHCYIGIESYRYSGHQEIKKMGKELKGGVLLKKGCWIGAGSMIFDGVTVGEGSIVGAGSLVMDDVPDYCVAYGSPAKIVKKRVGI